MINWTIGVTDAELINKVVKRALNLGIVKKRPAGRRTRVDGIYDPLSCDMDLTACHLNGMALDLNKLMEFPDFDFMHDICGIARHINRETGKIEDLFMPRCSRPETVND